MSKTLIQNLAVKDQEGNIKTYLVTPGLRPGVGAFSIEAINDGRPIDESLSNWIDWGNTAIASGEGAIAIGNGVKAAGKDSVALGWASQAYGRDSFAMGHLAIAGDKDKDPATITAAIALGLNARALGQFSCALNARTVASGYCSLATGEWTEATGKFSFAGGYGAENNHVVASGTGASAFGMFRACLLQGSLKQILADAGVTLTFDRCSNIGSLFQEANNLTEIGELASTDYKAIKYAEGWLTEEEYAPIKAQRQAIRDEINILETQL